MKAKRRVVHCNKHGEGKDAYLCQHLIRSAGFGFHTAKFEGGDGGPIAWCNECERVYREESYQCTEKFLAYIDLRLACDTCFRSVKRAKLRVVNATS